MKNDRQFIDSVYKKRDEKLGQYKKAAAFTVFIVFVLTFMASTSLLPLNKNRENDERIENEYLIITAPSENSAESSKSETIKDKGLGKLVHLSCPIEVSENNITTSSVNDEYAVITFNEKIYVENGFYYAPAITPDNNFKTLVALEANPLTTFVYNGKSLSELFTRTGYGWYIFKDGEHELFNEFQLEYEKWYAENGIVSLKKELEDKADNGDKTAAELLETYKDTDKETIFYSLVWSADKTQEETSELNVQRTEFNQIWEQAKESGNDVLITSYKEEIEKLVAEGYDLEFVTVDGTVKLVGALTAEQAEYFNKDERFNYTVVWLKAAYEDKLDLVFAGSDEIIEVPRNETAKP